MAKNILLQTELPYRERLGAQPYSDPGIDCSKDEPAKQEFKDECDINHIIARYVKDGVIDHVNRVEAVYGDFTSVGDYHGDLNRLIEAQEAFDGLPAQIRKRFANDPAELLSFLMDENNRTEAEKLGLVKPRPVKDDGTIVDEKMVKKAPQGANEPPVATGGSTTPT